MHDQLILDNTHEIVYNGNKRTEKRFLFGSAYTKPCTQEEDVGTYPLETIIREWKNAKLTTEQAVGQILLLIQDMQKQLTKLESRLFRYEQTRKP
jgi:hypothetical protein